MPKHAVIFVVALGVAGPACRRAAPIATPPSVAEPAPQAVTVEPARVAPPTAIPPGQAFVIAAAGDVSPTYIGAQAKTASLLRHLVASRALAAILVLGDLQYPDGAYADFQAYYRPTWGDPALLPLQRPVPGNHDYGEGTSDAAGYFDFFNGVGALDGPAGRRGVGYYAFEMGDWQFLALNTSDGCRRLPCAPGSPMYEWLRGELAAARRPCVLAYFHHPRFQHGALHQDNAAIAPLWQALVEGGADLALSGHEHNFQALAPLDAAGRVDRERGVPSFVVGTGGASPYLRFDPALRPEAVIFKASGRHGVLELTLSSGGYAWRFVAVAAGDDGETVARGEGACRR